MSMQYLWKNGYRGLRGDVQVVGQELERIQEETGSISADLVLENAKPKDAPLHPYFEWNNTKAAEMYRLDQARYLVRNIAVQIERPESDEPLVTRAFVEIKGEEGPYLSLSTVVQDVDLWKQLIKQARKDIEVFENKYSVLSEVVALIQPIKVALNQLVI